MNTVQNEIIERLTTLFPNAIVNLRDDSAHHQGHVHNTTGGGHYTLTIVSEHFAGLPSLARHRTIYEALNGLIPDKVHALKIIAMTEQESL